MKKTIYEQHNDWRDDFVPIGELSECDEGYQEACDECCDYNGDDELIEDKYCDRYTTYWFEMSYSKHHPCSVRDRLRGGE